MRLSRFLAPPVLALALPLLLGAAAVEAPPDQGWVARQVSKLLSKPGRTIAIGGIALGWPDRLTITGLDLGDADGTWLHVDRAELAITLRRLITGHIEIARLHVDRAALARLPAEQSQGGSGGGSTAIKLDDLAIDALDLGAPLLGAPASVSVKGKVDLQAARDQLTLAIARIDGEAGGAALALDYAPQEGKLVADAHLDEPSGMLVERLSGRRAPLSLSLAGAGPLADWRGRLAAQAGNAAAIESELAISQQGKSLLLETSGRLAAPAFVPAEYAAALGPTQRFAARLARDEAGRIALEALRIDTASATLTGAGSYDATSGALAGSLEAALADFAPLSALAGAPLAGQGGARLALGGTLQSPVATLTLAAEGPRYGGDGAERLVATIDLGLAGQRIALSGSGRIDGVALASGPLPAGLGEAIEWRLGGGGEPGGTLVLDGLEITDRFLLASLAGRLDGGAAEGTASLVAADLGLLPQPGWRGASRLDIALAADTLTGRATARLSGAGDGLAGPDPLIAAVLGEHQELAGVIRREADGSVVAEDFALSAAALRLAGTASLPAALDRLAAQLTLDVPRLAALAPATGAPLEGRASAKLDLTGPFSALAAELRLAADGLASGEARIGHFDAALALADLGAPRGSFMLRLASPDGLTGAGQGEVALRDGRLALSKLFLDAGGARLAGDLDVALAETAATGAVSLRVPDLAAFSRLAGTPLAGRLDAQAKLTRQKGQAAEVKLSGERLAIGAAGPGQLALGRIAGQARLADLLGTPIGQGELHLAGFARGAETLDKADLTLASIGAGRFRIGGDLAGTVAAPLSIGFAGEARIAGAAKSLRLTRLDGSYADGKLALARPLLLETRGGAMQFSDLALAIGDGRLEGEGKLAGTTLSLRLKGDKLPIELGARIAGFHEVGGRLGVDVDLAGTLAAPRGRLVVTGDDLRFAAASRPDLPPLALSARGDWQGGRFDLRGRVDAPGSAAIGFSGSAPIELRQPLAVAFPREGRIALKLEGAGELADISDLLPLPEDRIAGKYVIDVNIGGTVASPLAGGRFTLTGGRFEDIAAGTVLSQVDLELDGDQQRFVMRRFSATDGEKGHLGMEGGVDLVATPGSAIALRVALQKFHAVRRDDADLTASGKAEIGGTLAAPRLDADVTVDRGELQVPDKLPASSPNLAVIRVNSRTGAVAPAAAKPEAPPRLPVVLAVRVRAPGQLFVRGRGLDSEWRGDLRVTGTSAAPVVTGSLEIVRGTFSLLGKDFNLTSGTITFPGGQSIDPALDLLAEATTSGITAEVLIRGTAAAPTLTLTSTPVLPQDEILSRVLFGTSVTQMTAVQGLQLAAAAASLASGGGGPDVLGSIRQGLGLDRLSIGSADSSTRSGTSSSEAQKGNALAGTTLQAGKYVAPGFYVGVEQGASAGSSALRVEREVTRHISLGARVGAQSRESVGVDFKLDY